MRVQKPLILLLILAIFLARFSCGSTARDSRKEKEQRPRNENSSSMFSQRDSEILNSLRTRKTKIVSHRNVPTGPNPLHN
ncbi:hypothetical protein L484_015770 [Morus notabilis]|uniref:Uncharacterized protein n=1 Tax=Morus notabilis TaxID=981085 RepID=W9S7H2_9ROSA|nr:hypothetical protein L484_015770 [Morus notabilis]